LDDADGQAEEVVDRAHPARIASGEVVVDRDQVSAASRNRVQNHGRDGDKGFSFAGLHFGDPALVQNRAAE